MQLAGAAGNAIDARDDDAVEQVGYFMDIDGHRIYSRADVTLLQRVIAGNDSGFSAWRNTDAVIVGDMNSSGQLKSLDASRLLLQAIGIARPEIPPLPVAIPPAPVVPLVEIATPVPLAPTAPPAPPTPAAPPTPTRVAAAADAALLATAASTTTALAVPQSTAVNWSAAPAQHATVPWTSAVEGHGWKSAGWVGDLSERLARPVADSGLKVSASQTASRFWRAPGDRDGVSRARRDARGVMLCTRPGIRGGASLDWSYRPSGRRLLRIKQGEARWPRARMKLDGRPSQGHRSRHTHPRNRPRKWPGTRRD